jgi:hypothetical protein
MSDNSDKDYETRQVAMDWAYNKVLKGVALITIGVVLIGSAFVKESKVSPLFIGVGTVFGAYGFVEGFCGVKVLKRL